TEEPLCHGSANRPRGANNQAGLVLKFHYGCQIDRRQPHAGKFEPIFSFQKRYVAVEAFAKVVWRKYSTVRRAPSAKVTQGFHPSKLAAFETSRQILSISPGRTAT